MALADSKLEKVRGDALKNEDVEAALIGVDVVIQTWERDWAKRPDPYTSSQTRPGC